MLVTCKVVHRKKACSKYSLSGTGPGPSDVAQSESARLEDGCNFDEK